MNNFRNNSDYDIQNTINNYDDNLTSDNITSKDDLASNDDLTSNDSRININDELNTIEVLDTNDETNILISSINSNKSEFLCRICYDVVEEPKIYCKCIGDTSYIHKECLLKWLSVKGLSEHRYVENQGKLNETIIYEYKYLCDVCHTPYEYTINDNTPYYSCLSTTINVIVILIILITLFILNYTHQNRYILLIYLWILLIFMPFFLKKINTYIESKKKVIINIFEIDQNIDEDDSINNNDFSTNIYENDNEYERLL